MKRFVKNVCMLLLLLWVCAGCKEVVKAPLLTKVADVMREGVPALNLGYDRDGNITQYGNTPIKYNGDQIIVGAMDIPGSDGKLLEAVFTIGKGRAKESHARCILETKHGEVEAEKKTTYQYQADTLIIHSDYYSVADRSFIRNVQGKYVLDGQKRMSEVRLTYREANDSVYSRCAHYNYENNLSSVANLNLQAYVVDHDGADGFLYFLLNLARFSDCGPLPNDIDYSLEPSGALFGLHANYRMIGEQAIRIEVLRENAELLSRIDLSYDK